MIYFVTAGRADEIYVIQQLKPERILVSFHYFKNKSLKDLIEQIGYTPEILLDSGAWSAFTTGKNIALVDYINYVEANKGFITHYIALDVIGDDEFTKRYYDMMLTKGLAPIPVFHEGGDLSYLDYYVSSNPPFIALGGTAANRSKPYVRDWVLKLQELYPGQLFHLLGSSSKQIIDHTNLRSFDSSTWIMMALNGFPKEIPGKNIEDKRKRMIYQMEELMK